jgi:hypothetical protein
MEKLINNIFIWYIFFMFIILIFFSNNYNFNKTNEKFSTFNNGFITESANQGSIVCAKSCCNSGWPASIEIDETNFGVKPGDMGTKYRATSSTCITGLTSGCVCARI